MQLMGFSKQLVRKIDGGMKDFYLVAGKKEIGFGDENSQYFDL